jgi:hypothetical protein
MTPSELITFHRETFERLNEMIAKKNADYTGGDDALKNFLMVEQFGAASASQGFFTRMVDKLARMASFVKKGVFEVNDESVDDTLGDIANYAVLWMAYLKVRRMQLNDSGWIDAPKDHDFSYPIYGPNGFVEKIDPKAGQSLVYDGADVSWAAIDDLHTDYRNEDGFEVEKIDPPEGIRYADDYVVRDYEQAPLYEVTWKGKTYSRPEDVPEFVDFLKTNNASYDWMRLRRTTSNMKPPRDLDEVISTVIIWDDSKEWHDLHIKWREECKSLIL